MNPHLRRFYEDFRTKMMEWLLVDLENSLDRASQIVEEHRAKIMSLLVDVEANELRMELKDKGNIDEQELVINRLRREVGGYFQYIGRGFWVWRFPLKPKHYWYQM